MPLAFGIARPEPRLCVWVLVTAVVAIAPQAALGSSHKQLQPPGQRPTSSIARWAPAYTLPPSLPDFVGATSMAVIDGATWLATETFVSRYDLGVWSPPDALSDAGSIFTISPTPTDLWAFGFEGGAWRRTEGGWTTLPQVSGADFYASTPFAAGAVAVGFDFATEYGTVIQADPQGVTSTVHDWMFRRQLLAVAASPGGELWAGGCDYESNLFLMKKGLDGPWEEVSAPAAAGCIYDISFASDGSGMAAAGGAVLGWIDGEWMVLTGAADDGRQWLRVAATLDRPASGPTDTVVTGWAMAATPRWPAFVDPVLPQYFDGSIWSSPLPVSASGGPAGIDAVESGRSVLALESDGRTARAVARLGNADAPLPNGGAALISLEAGQFALAHPLITSVEDLVAENSGGVWAGGRGAVGVLHRSTDWQPSAVGAPRLAERLDFAERFSGWTLGVFSVAGPISTTYEASSYWNGRGWRPSPPGALDAALQDVRAMADGRVWGWGRLREGVLLERDPTSAWRPVVGAPRLELPPAGGPPGTPFDVVQANGRTVGWVAGATGLFRYDNGTFQEVPLREALEVTDVQLVNARSGWALAYASAPGGGGAPRRTRQLFRIADRDWQRVPDLGLGVRAVEWSQLAVASADEAWLLGVSREGGAPRPLLARFNGRWEMFGDPGGDGDTEGRSIACSATRLDAVARDDGTTEVWLGGTTAPCGPTARTSVQPTGDYAGPISVLSVSPVRGTAFLPTTTK